MKHQGKTNKAVNVTLELPCLLEFWSAICTFNDWKCSPAFLKLKPRRSLKISKTRLTETLANESLTRTLHNCWPGESSSKGCRVKHWEQANKAVVLLIIQN